MTTRTSPEVDKAIKDVLSIKNTNNPLIEVADIPNNLKYRPGAPRKPSRHIGQYKLLMNEWQFLNSVLGDLKTQTYVVYAGAAPSNHIWWLSMHFPSVKFILVDPAEFVIYMGGDGAPPIVSDTHYEQLFRSRGSKPFPIQYLFANVESKYEKKHRVIQMIGGSDTLILDKDVSADIKKIHAMGAHNMASGGRVCELIKTAPASVRIFIIEDFFTTDLAHELAPLNPHFVSDIRTNINGMRDALWYSDVAKINKDNGGSDHPGGSAHPGDLDLIWNLAQQYIWGAIIRSTCASGPGRASVMLKFRAPYMRDIDRKIIMRCATEQPFHATFIEYKKLTGESIADQYLSGKFRYVGGKLYIQPWSGQNSSETRLVFKNENIMTYDVEEYNDKLFYYNSVLRQYQNHVNAHADAKRGFDHCNDCALTAAILDEYCRKFDVDYEKKFKNWTAILDKMTGRCIKGFGHGGAFGVLTWDYVLKVRAQSQYS